MNVARSRPGRSQTKISAAKIASSSQLTRFTHGHSGPGTDVSQGFHGVRDDQPPGRRLTIASATIAVVAGTWSR